VQHVNSLKESDSNPVSCSSLCTTCLWSVALVFRSIKSADTSLLLLLLLTRPCSYCRLLLLYNNPAISCWNLNTQEISPTRNHFKRKYFWNERRLFEYGEVEFLGRATGCCKQQPRRQKWQLRQTTALRRCLTFALRKLVSSFQ